MKNRDVIEKLCKVVRYKAVGQFAYEDVVRAVLSRLAEIGFTDEMERVVQNEWAETDLSFNAERAFRTAIRSLLDAGKGET